MRARSSGETTEDVPGFCSKATQVRRALHCIVGAARTAQTHTADNEVSPQAMTQARAFNETTKDVPGIYSAAGSSLQGLNA